MNELPDSGEFDADAQNYVDGEMTVAERREFENRMRSDQRLATEVAHLSTLRRRLREAYPLVDRHRVRRGVSRARMTVAVALIVGVAVGYCLSLFLPSGDAFRVVADQAPAESMTRVLLHVSTDDPVSVREAFTSARYILDDFAYSGKPVRVHVVANGRGLHVFRRSVTRFGEEIRELERTYSNIQFVTCQNTIDRFEKEEHRQVDLLPEVMRVDSIVADIARKRVQGWVYIGV
jgi:intracellular sulfur oxidation DsrE/DsrF family protein